MITYKLDNLIKLITDQKEIAPYQAVKANLDKTSKRTVETLKNRPHNDERVIYMFAGPNGSGKSTIISTCLDAGLCPPVYICPDFLLGEAAPTTEEYLKAMQKAEKLRKTAVKRGVSFTFETVLSSAGKINFLKKAKKRGFRIATIYVTTEDPEINIGRVKQRVEEGGHDVPEQSIINRYTKSMRLIPEALALSNEYILLDNSDITPVRAAEYQHGILIVNEDYSKKKNFEDLLRKIKDMFSSSL